MYLSIFIAVGLLCSYLPQHYRIISTRSSEGFSPWFLLLGGTSSTASLANVLTLQWGVVRCCRLLTPGRCAESMLGIVQIFLQWLCFNIVLILFLIYYPRNKKYVLAVPVSVDEEDAAMIDGTPNGARFNLVTRASSRILSRFFSKTTRSGYNGNKKDTGNVARPRSSSAVTTETVASTTSSDSSFDPASVLPPSATRAAPLVLSPEYSLSLFLGGVVLLHFLASILITAGLLLALPKASSHEPGSLIPGASNSEHISVRVLRLWASFCGLLSMFLACSQYLPQILYTARLRLVGSLSVPMMCIQTPGSFVFVYSLATRPGVNWTTWLVYLITGLLQGCLLAMCIAWKIRQRVMGVDDFGRDKRLYDLRREAEVDSLAEADAHGPSALVPEGPGVAGERRPLLAGSQAPLKRGLGSRSGKKPRGSQVAVSPLDASPGSQSAPGTTRG